MHTEQTESTQRVELHLHTKYSAMDGLCDVSDAVRRAAEAGYSALAITDHGVVQAFPEAALACRKAQQIQPGFKVIYGCEINFMPDDTRRAATGTEAGPVCFSMTLLAANQTGLKNLYRIITASHSAPHLRPSAESRWAGPLVPQSLLERHREGLLVGSACADGELYRAVLAHRDEALWRATADYYDYLEIQPGGDSLPLLAAGRDILRLGRALGKPVAATGDVHFLRRVDQTPHAILQAETGRESPPGPPPRFFRTTAEMLREFAWLPQQDAHDVVVRFPNQIAQRVSPDVQPLPSGERRLPTLPDSDALLRACVWEGATAAYGDPLPAPVEARLNRELEGITGAGHAALFVASHRLATESKLAGYPVLGRGGVGASSVAYFAGIGEVNPLPPHYRCPRCRHHAFVTDGSVASGFDLPPQSCPRCGGPLTGDGHNIPCETFLGLDARKLPDIELSYCVEYLPQAHRHFVGLFGADRVFYAGTVNTLTKTAAGQLAQKALGEGHGAGWNGTARALADCLTGVKTADGWFPGGLLLVPDGYDIHDFTPVQPPPDGGEHIAPSTHFDYRQLQHALLKVHLLGHNTGEELWQLECRTGVSASDIPMNDTAVYSLLTHPTALGVTAQEIGCETGTMGIPELDTPHVWSILREIRPRCFGELTKVIGLSHGLDTWFGNARETLRIRGNTLSDTFGARDDIFLYLLDKGMAREDAYAVMEQVCRGAAARKGFDADTLALLCESGVPEHFIDSCEKIRYLFPKAHAVADLISSVHLLWYKLYHPRAFYATLFSVQKRRLRCWGTMPDRAAVTARLHQLAENRERPHEEDEEFCALRLLNECLCRGVELRQVLEPPPARHPD